MGRARIGGRGRVGDSVRLDMERKDLGMDRFLGFFVKKEIENVAAGIKREINAKSEQQAKR